MKNEEYRQRICHECNLYMDICNGRRLYKLPPRGKACVNRVLRTRRALFKFWALCRFTRQREGVATACWNLLLGAMYLQKEA